VEHKPQPSRTAGGLEQQQQQQYVSCMAEAAARGFAFGVISCTCVHLPPLTTSICCYLSPSFGHLPSHVLLLLLLLT
jgi:hypothetical protein